MTTTVDIGHVRPQIIQSPNTFSCVIYTILLTFATIASFIGASGLYSLGDSLKKAMHYDDGEWYIEVHSYFLVVNDTH